MHSTPKSYLETLRIVVSFDLKIPSKWSESNLIPIKSPSSFGKTFDINKKKNEKIQRIEAEEHRI